MKTCREGLLGYHPLYSIGLRVIHMLLMHFCSYYTSSPRRHNQIVLLDIKNHVMMSTLVIIIFKQCPLKMHFFAQEFLRRKE